jgi:hypothetical protein
MLTALNAVKVTFVKVPKSSTNGFLCYSKAGSRSGSANQYYDLLSLRRTGDVFREPRATILILAAAELARTSSMAS